MNLEPEHAPADLTDPTQRVFHFLCGYAEIAEGLYEPAQTAGPLVWLLDTIRAERAALATFADRVERDLLAVMGDRKIVVPGIGEVAARKSIKRTKWQNHDLYVRVVARALDERKLDEETGEYESEGSAVARVLEECARPSWRLAPLRALGIDPDEWCETDEGAWSVQLPGRQL